MTELAKFFSLHRKFLLYNLLMRNLKVRYRKSILGFMWTLIVPMTMTLVYYFVFQYIARMGDDKFAIFLLTGIIPWTFFSTAFLSATDSLVANYGILNKVPISITVFPLSEVCSAFVNLVLSLPVLVVAALIFGVMPTVTWMAIPLLLAILLLQTYALGFIAAVFNIYMRDVRHLVGIGIQIWMYMTPVLYSSERIPEHVRHYFYFNPLYAIFDSFHKTFLENKWPEPLVWVAILSWALLLTGAAFALSLRVRYKLVEKI